MQSIPHIFRFILYDGCWYSALLRAHGEKAGHLNRFFTAIDVKDMPEGNFYHVTNMSFASFAA